MGKRVIFSFLLTVVFSCALILRIAIINNSIDTQTATTQSTRKIYVSSSRGMIYDRNMVPLVNRKVKTVLAVDPTSEAMECLKKQMAADEYSVATEKSKNGTPFVIECENYNGDCDDIVSMSVCQRYSSDDVATHIIGYTDLQENGVSGVESSFNGLLNENSGTLSIRYNADATGKVLKGDGISVIDDNYMSVAGVVLTIDKEIQRICEQSMERNEIERGAVVVLDVQKSEILAMISTPEYDRENMSVSLDDENSPFLNRAINAYAVGSVFKPIVAIAALNEGISEDTVFECKGYVTINGQRFNCHKKDGHGKITMSQAIAVSCNSYFIQLGRLVGAENIVNTGSLVGLGKEIELCDSIKSVKGNLPNVDTLDSLASLANLSFGQGTLLATPLQIAAMYCAFANGGYYRQPYMFKEIVDSKGVVTAYYENEIDNKVIPDSICKKICEMLSETVTDGSGKLAKPMCYNASGKTATAETGWVENGEPIYHTWFAGYFPSEKPKYVIVVFNEKGSSSSTDCAPVFRDIADGITGLYG